MNDPVGQTQVVVDLWKTWAGFFKGDPMYVVISVVTILGFAITVFVYVKLRRINSDLRKGKKISNYLKEYQEILKIVESKNSNKPSDLFDRTEKLNKQFMSHISFFKKNYVKRIFKLVDKTDNTFAMLKRFLNDIVVQFEKDAV